MVGREGKGDRAMLCFCLRDVVVTSLECSGWVVLQLDFFKRRIFLLEDFLPSHGGCLAVGLIAAVVSANICTLSVLLSENGHCTVTILESVCVSV